MEPTNPPEKQASPKSPVDRIGGAWSETVRRHREEIRKSTLDFQAVPDTKFNPFTPLRVPSLRNIADRFPQGVAIDAETEDGKRIENVLSRIPRGTEYFVSISPTHRINLTPYADNLSVASEFKLDASKEWTAGNIRRGDQLFITKNQGNSGWTVFGTSEKGGKYCELTDEELRKLRDVKNGEVAPLSVLLRCAESGVSNLPVCVREARVDGKSADAILIKKVHSELPDNETYYLNISGSERLWIRKLVNGQLAVGKELKHNGAADWKVEESYLFSLPDKDGSRTFNCQRRSKDGVLQHVSMDNLKAELARDPDKLPPVEMLKEISNKKSSLIAYSMPLKGQGAELSEKLFEKFQNVPADPRPLSWAPGSGQSTMRARLIWMAAGKVVPFGK